MYKTSVGLLVCSSYRLSVTKILIIIISFNLLLLKQMTNDQKQIIDQIATTFSNFVKRDAFNNLIVECIMQVIIEMIDNVEDRSICKRFQFNSTNEIFQITQILNKSKKLCICRMWFDKLN